MHYNVCMKQQTLNQLVKTAGLRNTHAIRQLLKILTESPTPVDVNYLVEKMEVNKSTTYRGLKRLISLDIVVELDFGDRRKRYELVDRDHHHHLVCRSCGQIEDVKVDESLLLSAVASRSSFKIQSHALEYFGLCGRCQE